MAIDKSNGWEAVAEQLISNRNPKIGASIIRQWATSFEPGSSILDLGCGTGEPVTRILLENGLTIYGIDASPTLLGEYRKRFPYLSSSCEAAQESVFFNKKFDGIVAIGLLFLLSKENQCIIIKKVADALKPQGRFLFTAPYQVHSWKDNWTGYTSLSLGRKAYKLEFAKHGLILVNEYTDEGENHHFEFHKNDWHHNLEQQDVESIEITELPVESSNE